MRLFVASFLTGLLVVSLSAIPRPAEAGRWSSETHGSQRVAHWVESLTWPDADVREVSARALGAVGDPGAVRPLMGALDDRSGHVRVAAAWALGELDAVGATGELVRMGSKDPYSPARASALRALWKIGGQDAIKPMRLGLTDRDPTVRATAAEGLAFVAGAAAFEDLREMLDDSNWSVRLAACLGIGTMEQLSAAEPLEIVLRTDAHDYVRAAAARALGQTGGNLAVIALKRAIETDPSARVHLEAIRALVHLRVPLSDERKAVVAEPAEPVDQRPPSIDSIDL